MPTQPLEMRLLALLNLAAPTARDQDEIRALAAKADWPRVARWAELNAVLVLTWKRIRELGLEDLAARGCGAAWDDWASRAARISDSGDARARHAQAFLKAAADRGIKVIPLKGGLLGPLVYRDASYKKMNDVDVLVRREDAPAFAELLKEQGFQSVGALLGEEEFSDSTHHCPPYFSADLSCVVGIHWSLCSPYSRWKPDVAAIWKDAESAVVFNAPAWRMSWEHNLLHLCMHLPFYKIGLRELADVYNLGIHARGGIDWAGFARDAAAWRIADPVYRVLSLARAMHDYDVPASVLADCEREATPFTLRDTAIRLEKPEILIQSRSTQIAKVEKAFSVFRLSRKYSERVLAWAATWKFTFWPSMKELRKLACLPPEGEISLAERVRARVRAPGLVWNAMARDYGHFALALITGINALIVARETLLFPFRPRAEGIRSHPAAKLLETLE